MAVHWRRGDRTHPEMGAGGAAQYDAVAPAALVRFVRRLLRLRPRARRVLLLSNSGVEEDWRAVQAALPGVVQYVARWAAGGGAGAGRSWRTLQHDAIVEQCLASLADGFLAGPWHFDKLSTFARVVVEERALLGQPPNSTFYMQPRGRLVMHLRDGSAMTAEMRAPPGDGEGDEVPGPPGLHCEGCVE